MRPGIFEYRPAPVHVSYLGYPGTLGAPWMDCLLADAVLVPEGNEIYYSEKIVRLHGSYQINDRTRLIAEQLPSRASQGLPDKGLVIRCFNINYNHTPEVFALWLRLLQKIDGSVLWLLKDNDDAEQNLCREALALGVAASLLHAVDMPGLVTYSLADYEQKALYLASNPQQLGALRSRLTHQGLSAPLFDSPRTNRHIEAAFIKMHAWCEQGEVAAALDVAPVP